MPYGMGRRARSLILLGVILGHGLLLLLLPGSVSRSLSILPMQVQLVSATVPHAPAQKSPEPVAAKKQLMIPTKPRPVEAVARRPAPTAPAPSEIKLPPAPVSSVPERPAAAMSNKAPPWPEPAADMPVANTAAVGAAQASSAVAMAPEQRKAARCDTRLRDSDYPVSARRDEQEGRVLIQVRVLQSGQTQDAKVVKSSGIAVLDQAALRASLHWSCTAASLNGAAIDSWVAVPVVFRID